MAPFTDLKRWLALHKMMQKKEPKAKLQKGYAILLLGNENQPFSETQKLAKEIGKEIYRLDLSQVVSKYIGETEKNLSAIFEKAADRDWVLFFDEADALFGKRTTVKDSHDRYANREIRFILDKLARYPGVVILATNTRQNIDKAFIRRFSAVVWLDKD